MIKTKISDLCGMIAMTDCHLCRIALDYKKREFVWLPTPEDRSYGIDSL